MMSSNTEISHSKRREKKEMKKKRFIIFYLLLTMLMISACGKKASLIGEWGTREGKTKYVFFQDGTGVYYGSYDVPYDMEWSISGNILSIDLDSDRYYMEDARFNVKNGNQLILSRGNDEQILYKLASKFEF